MSIPRKYRFISLVLSAALLITSIPSTMFAALSAINAISEPVTNRSSTVMPQKEPQIIGEVIEKREENVKHFLLDDMTYEAVVYPEPVHYKQNGKWKDIDNTLATVKDETNVDIIENKSNDFKVKVAKSSKDDELVRIKKDGYELSWNIRDLNDSLAVVKAINTKELQSLSANEKATTLTKLQSILTFPEVFSNTDLEYIITPDDVKENLSLNKKLKTLNILLI